VQYVLYFIEAEWEWQTLGLSWVTHTLSYATVATVDEFDR